MWEKIKRRMSERISVKISVDKTKYIYFSGLYFETKWKFPMIYCFPQRLFKDWRIIMQKSNRFQELMVVNEKRKLNFFNQENPWVAKHLDTGATKERNICQLVSFLPLLFQSRTSFRKKCLPLTSVAEFFHCSYHPREIRQSLKI